MSSQCVESLPEDGNKSKSGQQKVGELEVKGKEKEKGGGGAGFWEGLRGSVLPKGGGVQTFPTKERKTPPRGGPTDVGGGSPKVGNQASSGRIRLGKFCFGSQGKGGDEQSSWRRKGGIIVAEGRECIPGAGGGVRRGDKYVRDR